MIRAYTAIDMNSEKPHFDVGPTFKTKQSCQNWINRHKSLHTPQQVVSWIDDFTDVDYGVFLVRTDGIHEGSFVVAEEPSDRIDTSVECCVETKIYSQAEALMYEKWNKF